MRTSVMAAALAILPGLAFGDEISGDWCGPDGRQITILGSRVVSFGGTETDGSYSRHRYEFAVPEGEADAGTSVVINQLSEEQARVSIGAGEPVLWTRCRPVTS